VLMISYAFDKNLSLNYYIVILKNISRIVVSVVDLIVNNSQQSTEEAKPSANSDASMKIEEATQNDCGEEKPGNDKLKVGETNQISRGTINVFFCQYRFIFMHNKKNIFFFLIWTEID
jgi:hypothetical protein